MFIEQNTISKRIFMGITLIISFVGEKKEK